MISFGGTQRRLQIDRIHGHGKEEGAGVGCAPSRAKGGGKNYLFQTLIKCKATLNMITYNSHKVPKKFFLPTFATPQESTAYQVRTMLASTEQS